MVLRFLDRDERAYRKAHKRLQASPLPVVHSWAGNALWSIQELLEQAPSHAALTEARTGVVTLLAAVDVLLDNDVLPGPN